MNENHSLEVNLQAQTYENIQSRKLARVPNNRDKLEGSVIWDAISTNSVELTHMYIELQRILRLTFAETSFGEFLEKRTAEHGVHRRPATRAVRLGIMTGTSGNPFDIPIGSRFVIENIHYTAIRRLDIGRFELEAETTGTIGNRLTGRLLPTPDTNIRGLARAELADVLVPAQDMETDDDLFERFEEHVNSRPFAGNVDHYVQAVNAIDGVGGCEVYRIRRGRGTGDIVIIDSEYNSPTPELIHRVQEIIDPFPYMTGMGKAPLDHDVKVFGVTENVINISLSVVLSHSTTLGMVQDEIKQNLETHMLNLRRGWERRDRITPKQPIVIRQALLIASLINITGIEDVKNISINGTEGNYTIGIDDIPVLGEIFINE